MRFRARPWIQNSALLLAATAVALLLSEAMVRRFVSIGSFWFESPSGTPFYTPDPLREYGLTPGWRGRLIAPEFSTSVAINSLGFRGEEPSPGDPKSRHVFVIGDSFVFGVGVEAPAAIPGRLQELMARRYGGCARVWNLGVPGYSPQQYVYTLERYLDVVRPEVVVIAIHAGRLPSGANDISGGADFAVWEQSHASAAERQAPTPAAAPEPSLQRPGLGSVKRWLFWHSALYNWVLLRAGPQVRALVHGHSTLTEADRARLERGWEILDAQLRRVMSLSAQRPFRLIVVHVPEQSDTMSGDSSTSARLRALAARHQCTFIDGLEVVAAGRSRDLYFPVDGHLNASGCDLFARGIAREITLDCPAAP